MVQKKYSITKSFPEFSLSAVFYLLLIYQFQFINYQWKGKTLSINWKMRLFLHYCPSWNSLIESLNGGIKFQESIERVKKRRKLMKSQPIFSFCFFRVNGDSKKHKLFNWKRYFIWGTDIVTRKLFDFSRPDIFFEPALHYWWRISHWFSFFLFWILSRLKLTKANRDGKTKALSMIIHSVNGH